MNEELIKQLLSNKNYDEKFKKYVFSILLKIKEEKIVNEIINLIKFSDKLTLQQFKQLLYESIDTENDLKRILYYE